VINNKYKSNLSSESIYVRVVSNRGKIKEKLDLVIETSNKEVSNNNYGMHLHSGYYLHYIIFIVNMFIYRL